MWEKIDMFDNLRNLLIIFTSIVTLSSIIIKTSNSFFIEGIKSNYKKQLGNQTLIKVMIELLFYIIAIIDIFGVIFFYIIPISQSISNKSLEPIKNFYFSNENNLYNNIMPIIIICITLILFISQIILTYRYYNKLKSEYINKVESRKLLDCIKINKIRIRISLIGLIPTGFLILSSILLFNMISDITIEGLLILGLVWINSLAILILLINLRKICSELIERNTYVFVFKEGEKEEDIKCNIYIEYDEHYLIFKDDKEMYIKKSEVKKVIKNHLSTEINKEVKIIKKYKDELSGLYNEDKHNEYRDVKMNILEYIKSNSMYMNNDYVSMEIERSKMKLETKKMPYLSILMSCFFAIIPFMITIFIDLVNKIFDNTIFKVSYSNRPNTVYEIASNNNSLIEVVSFVLIMAFYILVVFIVIRNFLDKKEREFQCLNIYISALEALEKEESEAISNESNEIVDDIKDIKKFLGI